MVIMIIGIIIIVFRKQLTEYGIKDREKHGFKKSAKWMKEHKKWHDGLLFFIGAMFIIAGISKLFTT
jgi:MFS-type transporter involved in bile tolerance (Atg22 family)